MVLMPKRVKYRKSQRGTRRGVATTGFTLTFGEFGLKVLENGWIKNTQIGQRLYLRVENFGVLFHRAIWEFFAMGFPFKYV